MSARAETPARAPRMRVRTVVIVGLVVSAVLAGLVSFYASGHPDGLEYVAGSLGFDTAATEHGTATSPLADYGVSGVESARLSGGLAGLIGMVLVGAVAFGLTWLLRRRAPRAHS